MLCGRWLTVPMALLLVVLEKSLRAPSGAIVINLLYCRLVVTLNIPMLAISLYRWTAVCSTLYIVRPIDFGGDRNTQIKWV